MPMDNPHLEPPNLNNLLLRQLLKPFILEITPNRMEIARERFGPVMNFPTSHIARTDHRVDLVRGDHLAILGRHLGCSVGDVEIAEQEDEHAHLLLL